MPTLSPRLILNITFYQNKLSKTRKRQENTYQLPMNMQPATDSSHAVANSKGHAELCPPTPYLTLSQIFDFPSQDQEKWWNNSAPMLSKALVNSGYDVHLQYQYLCFYYKYVVPVLGPFPREKTGIFWKTIMTMPGLPFEISLNYQKSKSLVRFGFEPSSYLTGTRRDPFNKIMTREVLNSFVKLGMGVEMEWFNHFVNELVLSEKEANLIQSGDSLKSPFKTQEILALDLKKSGEMLVKAYFYPGLKSLVKGVSPEKLAFDAIHKIDPDSQLAESVSMLNGYLDSRRGDTDSPESTPSISLLFCSCDLIDPSVSRIKLYVVEMDVSFARIEDVWTFGGRLKDPATLKGLELLRRLWSLFLIPEGRRAEIKDFHDIRGPPPKSGQLPLLFNFGLQPGASYPEPKIYLPVFGENDMAISKALEVFFSELGWTELSASYKENLASYL